MATRSLAVGPQREKRLSTLCVVTPQGSEDLGSTPSPPDDQQHAPAHNSEVAVVSPVEGDKDVGSAAATPTEIFRETREIKKILLRVATSTFHIGPLPPAQEFERYEKTLPGSADRILKMAESENAHGQAMDRTALASDREIAKRGQDYALVVTLFLGVMGALVTLQGYQAAGSAFVVGACVPIVAHFLGRRAAEPKTAREPREKESAATKPPPDSSSHEPRPEISSETTSSVS
jgi:uncharacterized membrane protein